MIKRLFSTINPSIIVTNNAWSKMIEISKIQQIPRFLFSAKSGGCNGFNYKLGSFQNIKSIYLKKWIEKMVPANKIIHAWGEGKFAKQQIKYLNLDVQVYYLDE